MVDAGDAVHVARGDRVKAREAARAAFLGEVLADGAQGGVWAAQATGGANGDHGIVGDQLTNLCHRNNFGFRHGNVKGVAVGVVD